MRTIIYGPPGTGKTHTLLQHIEKFLETTEPDKIGYFTFSKNAAIEGKERAALKFKLSLSDDLPYFQTLHSFCFNQLGLSRNQVMKEKHYKELGEKMGIEIEGTQQDEDHDGVFYSKNPYIQLINIARSKEIDPVKYYHLTDNPKVSLNKLKIISEELQRYKIEHGLVDFPDMIEKFLSGGDTPKLRVMFVDEAQDLSLIQWKLVRRIEESATDSFIAGDDDQGIYKWNGAHVNTFINLEGTQQDEDHDSVFYSKNPYIQLINIARSKEIDPVKYYHLTDNPQISLNKLKIISEELQRYKSEHGLVDFPDMIEKFLSGGDTPKLRVMFVDEAQDLSLIQWKLVRRIEESSTDSFIAGDDDQGIYKWNGAHVNTFINLEGTRKILEQSHRVPQKPFELANKIINKVKNRVDKKYYPKDTEGSVKRCQSLHEIDFTKGKWLVLATANYMLSDIGDVLDEKGLYWQRRKATPRVKNIYEIIQKWNELRTGVPMHYNDCKKISCKL